MQPYHEKQWLHIFLNGLHTNLRLLVVALQAIPIVANAVPQDPRVFLERQSNDHLSALHPRICKDCVDCCCDRNTQLKGGKEDVEDLLKVVQNLSKCLKLRQIFRGVSDGSG